MNAKTVVITGASTGIGLAVAQACLTAGLRVVAGVRSDDDADRLAKTGAMPLRLDVTDADKVAAAFEIVQTALAGGPLLGLVNNAGIAIPGPLEALTSEQIDRQFQVNVVGLHRVTVAMLPLMNRGSRIVNLSSVSGGIVFPLLGAYAASKFAVEALSRAMRIELAGRGIGVSVVAPGAIRTPIWNKAATSSRSLLVPERYAEPMRRLEEVATGASENALPPERVAEAVAYCLTCRRPPRKIVVARNRLANWSIPRRLPGWLFDRLARRQLKLD